MDSGFLLENYIKDLDYCLENSGKAKSKRIEEKLRRKRDELESWFRKMRFKEYYAVYVGIRCSATTIKYWLVAIDLHFEEVSIMRDGTERNHFFLSLGAEHDNLYHAKIDFAMQVSENFT